MMTFVYDSKGEKVKTYDLHQMFSEESWSSGNGMNIPFWESRDFFLGIRETMKDNIRHIAKVAYGEDVVICYRELEHVRLDVLGFSDKRVYKAWLTKPSTNLPFGQVRSTEMAMPDGVRLQGNGVYIS
jgi:hypothetical protein